jgi:hypothetical protein
MQRETLHRAEGCFAFSYGHDDGRPRMMEDDGRPRDDGRPKMDGTAPRMMDGTAQGKSALIHPRPLVQSIEAGCSPLFPSLPLAASLPRWSLLPHATARYRTLQLLSHASARYSCYRTLPHATHATERYRTLQMPQ